MKSRELKIYVIRIIKAGLKFNLAFIFDIIFLINYDMRGLKW
ncbi:hypothetical protein [Caloramator sp. E03]|nr:hypothetical protein [Caloramator sp. E03]